MEGPTMDIKLAIIGGRTFNDLQLFNAQLELIRQSNTISQIISGGAKGADTFAANYAKSNNIPLLEFIPDWTTFGKSAGFRRNVDIITACTACLAFWNNKSKGTKHSIDLAIKCNKPLCVCYYND